LKGGKKKVGKAREKTALGTVGFNKGRLGKKTVEEVMEKGANDHGYQDHDSLPERQG